MVRIVLAAVVGLVMVFPLWIMLITAFSGQQRFDTISLIPQRFWLDNFTRVFASWSVGAWFVNS